MSKPRRHLFLGGLGLLVVLGAFGYMYLNPSHRNIQEEEVKLTLTAKALAKRFQIAAAQNELVDQVVQVEGRVTALDERSMTIDRKVEVDFTKKLPTDLALEAVVTIKGRCVGYDDLLALVKIDQANLVER